MWQWVQFQERFSQFEGQKYSVQLQFISAQAVNRISVLSQPSPKSAAHCRPSSSAKMDGNDTSCMTTQDNEHIYTTTVIAETTVL